MVKDFQQFEVPTLLGSGLNHHHYAHLTYHQVSFPEVLQKPQAKSTLQVPPKGWELPEGREQSKNMLIVIG